ncbi:programmed cell death protein 7 [Ambystoma mexicanum]|uniref:programmed cell death protein 7 n=1 Tax=Ambystoma mexicanum TaxID=8296 RepID=UPI0037E78C42
MERPLPLGGGATGPPYRPHDPYNQHPETQAVHRPQARHYQQAQPQGLGYPQPLEVPDLRPPCLPFQQDHLQRGHSQPPPGGPYHHLQQRPPLEHAETSASRLQGQGGPCPQNQPQVSALRQPHAARGAWQHALPPMPPLQQAQTHPLQQSQEVPGQQAQGSPFQIRSQVPAYGQVQSAGTPHLQPQGATKPHAQLQDPPYQQAQGPYYSKEPPLGPPFQAQSQRGSCPRQESQAPPSQAQLQGSAHLGHQPQSPAFQAQTLGPISQHAQISGGFPQTQEPPYHKQDSVGLPHPKHQPQAFPLKPDHHQGAPYQQANPSLSFPPQHAPSHRDQTFFPHQASRGNVPPGQGMTQFPANSSSSLPSWHLNPSSSELQRKGMDSQPKPAVSKTLSQVSLISDVPQYGGANPLVPPAALNFVCTDPSRRQGVPSTIGGDQSLQNNHPLPNVGSGPLLGDPMFPHHGRKQLHSYPPPNQPERGQMHLSSPSPQPASMQVPCNTLLPNSGRLQVPNQSQFTQPDRMPVQSHPPFVCPDGVSMQGPPVAPSQSVGALPQNHGIPVQVSHSYKHANDVHMQAKMQFPSRDGPRVEGNCILPYSATPHMLSPAPLPSADNAHVHTTPTLLGPQRISGQSEGSLIEGGHPREHSERAPLQNNRLIHQDTLSGQFPRLDKPLLQSGPPLHYPERPPPQCGPSFPPPVQGNPSFPHPVAPHVQFAHPLPPPVRPPVQGDNPFTHMGIAPVEWQRNTDPFANHVAPLVCSGQNQHASSTKELNNRTTNPLDEETVQRKQDEQWITRFLARRRQFIPPVAKRVATPSIVEARELVFGAQKLVSELRMVCQVLQENAGNEDVWSGVYLQAINIHKELQDKMKVLKRPGYIESVKKKLEKIKKKRLRIKREKQETPTKKEEALRAAEREAKIDKWRMKRVHEVEEKKREREVKAAADSVLSEVLKKQGDTKRMVSVLRALEKLRKLRKEAAARKGVFPPPSADEIFENHIKRLRVLIKERTELYDAEERALRVMLEGEQEEERKREREKKQKKEKEKLLQQQREIDCILFGEPEELPPDHPLQPFRQYYLQAEHSLPSLIQVRQEWDQYLVPSDHPGGSCIPPGWVVPGPPTSDAWAAAVNQMD